MILASTGETRQVFLLAKGGPLRKEPRGQDARRRARGKTWSGEPRHGAGCPRLAVGLTPDDVVGIGVIEEVVHNKARARLGFMAGEFTVPDDFDQMGSAEIETLFTGSKR